MVVQRRDDPRWLREYDDDDDDDYDYYNGQFLNQRYTPCSLLLRLTI